nr:hypothetical protein [Oceanisphaera sp. IT1-181]
MEGGTLQARYGLLDIGNGTLGAPARLRISSATTCKAMALLTGAGGFNGGI